MQVWKLLQWSIEQEMSRIGPLYLVLMGILLEHFCSVKHPSQWCHSSTHTSAGPNICIPKARSAVKLTFEGLNNILHKSHWSYWEVWGLLKHGYFAGSFSASERGQKTWNCIEKLGLMSIWHIQEQSIKGKQEKWVEVPSCFWEVFQCCCWGTGGVLVRGDSHSCPCSAGERYSKEGQ